MRGARCESDGDSNLQTKSSFDGALALLDIREFDLSQRFLFKAQYPAAAILDVPLAGG